MRLMAVIVTLGLAAHAPGIAYALDIPLTIEEPAGVNRVSDAVTSGVPVPPGSETASWSLWDGGTAIPVQVTSLHGSPPWVLLDFQTNVAPLTAKDLVLRDTPSSVAPVSSVTTSESATQITVTTGPLRVDIGKSPFNLLESVWLDRNGDGQFTPDEQGVTPTSNNIQLIDATSGQTYSTNGTPDEVTWEYKGPMRATLRVKGHYVDASGTPWIGYTTRITFFAGHTSLRIQHIIRNSYAANERNVKIRSATLRVGNGSQLVRTAHAGATSWVDVASSGATFQLVPAVVLTTDTDSNGGMIVPDLSYHGATLWVEFQDGLSSTEQARRSSAVQSPLVARADPSWYSELSAFGEEHIGTLDDEKATYRNWGWTWSSDKELVMPHLDDFYVHWGRVDVHNDLEADDVWQNLVMYARTGLRGYFDRAAGWANYYRWQFAYRTDGFDYAWDSDFEGPTKVARPLIPIPTTAADDAYLSTARLGRVDVRSWGADHIWAGGLVDYYHMTGDAEALDAAIDLAEVTWRIYWWRTPGACVLGEGGNGCPAEHGAREGARNLLVAMRVWEATGDTRWRDLADHIAQLWLQTPEWDARGFYFNFDSSLPGGRKQSPFQTALLEKSLYHYYLLRGDPTVRDRLIAIARFIQTNGLHRVYQYSGFRIVMDYPSAGQVWHGYFDDGDLVDFDPFYTLSLVDVETIGYRLTGDASLLDRAKVFWDRGSKGVYHDVTARNAGPLEVSRFVNSLAPYPPTQLLYKSNGDLTYVSQIWYDAARLNVVPDSTPPAPPQNLGVR